MSTQPHVIILGAGVVGLSFARRLAERGARVSLLDAASPSGLGSRAAAGVAIPSVRLLEDAAMRDFTRAARSYLAEDLQTLADGAALRRGAGILRVAADAKTRETLERKAAVEPEWLGRWLPLEEVVALEPALEGAPIAGAFATDAGHMVDTEGYLGALLADAARKGVSVHLSTRALRIEEEAQGVRVHSDAGVMEGDWLAVCAGAWSGQLPGLAPLPVRPVRGQMLTLFHPTLRLTRIVSGPSYLAPWRAGEIVVGATEEEAGFNAHTTPAGLLHLTATVARLSPRLREAAVTRTWAGLRSASPNGQPLIGPYPGARRVLLASGHGGQGILTGAISGAALVEWLEHGRSALAEAFAPERVLAQAPSTFARSVQSS